MILQALVEYYQRLVRDNSGIAAEGFEQKEIPFLIVLDQTRTIYFIAGHHGR